MILLALMNILITVSVIKVTTSLEIDYFFTFLVSSVEIYKQKTLEYQFTVVHLLKFVLPMYVVG